MVEPIHDGVLKFINQNRIRNGNLPGRKVLIFGEPKIGKTVLAARLGKHNWFVTDEDGYTALENESMRKLCGHWDGTVFEKWADVRIILQAAEAGQLICECGELVDNVILDTVSGMINHTVQQIIASGTTPRDGKVSPEAAGRPDYLVSRERLIPVMSQIATMRKVSVTLTMHTRETGKVKTQVLPDAHNSAYEVINKYVSVQAHLTMNLEGERMLQVAPTGNGVVAGSRYDFPKAFVTDDEFVAHIENWKGVI